MMEFRLYSLDGQGRVLKADLIEASSDDEAIVLARRKMGKSPFEIWERTRMVKREVPAIHIGLGLS